MLSRSSTGAQNGQELRHRAAVQVFSGGVSRSERALVARTDGSVQEVVDNIAKAVKCFGAAPGAKHLMDNELLAAEEALRSGLYGVWRNATRRTDFCSRVGPVSRCFCGHDFRDHVWKSKSRKELLPSCGSCGCRGFHYVPRRPEEVGEHWLPRRRGFDVRIWRAKCKCSHGHEDHDANHLNCRCCGCPSFASAWECVSCEGKWEDHETLFETEEERRLCGRPVGQAFKPLASTPEIQNLIFDGSAPSSSWSLPQKPRPERSVKLMLEQARGYGGPAAQRSLASSSTSPAAGFGSLEDAFPPARLAAVSRSALQDPRVLQHR